MIFKETPLKGAFLIDLEKKTDERGFFARSFCQQEFSRLNLETGIVQINTSSSEKKGTLRGIHYQLPPGAETKLIRCVRGALFDVIVDLRPESPTFLRWFGAELNEDNRTMMYVPKQFGHAFISLADNTEAHYAVSEFYRPGLERGLRWNDPKLNIKWPLEPVVISEKDRNHPDFSVEKSLQ